MNLYQRAITTAAATALVCSLPALAAGAGPDKVDRALAGALRSGAGTQKIIVTAQPGSTANVRQGLERSGRRIRSEHESLNLLVLEVSNDDVLELVKNKDVKGVSLDGPVSVQQWGGDLYDGGDGEETSRPIHRCPC